MEECSISVKGLQKYYGPTHAVDGISFSVNAGELFGFLGVNGAGKTTTIQMLSTLVRPTAGEAEICGHKLGHEDAQIRREIGWSLASAAIYGIPAGIVAWGWQERGWTRIYTGWNDYPVWYLALAPCSICWSMTPGFIGRTG